MYKKLLKKIVVYVMAAVLCAGMFVPMQAEAASARDVIGKWECSVFWIVFDEDGNATDPYNTREYHMESGSRSIEDYGTFSYDFYVVHPGDSLTSIHNNITFFKINGNDTLTMLNAVVGRDSKLHVDTYLTLSRPSSKSKKSHKENPEEVAKRKAEEAKKEEERKALEAASKEAARMAEEAAEKGFADMAQMQEAQAGGKSADEYYNNAVVNTEGIEDATPISQGGGLIINGEKTNVTATISKVSSFYVNSVRAAREGTVLNVVDVQFPAKEAVASFYMPGVAQGDAITAAQYIDGAWTDVEVTEVRADHVVLNLKNNGIVAFLKN